MSHPSPFVTFAGHVWALLWRAACLAFFVAVIVGQQRMVNSEKERVTIEAERLDVEIFSLQLALEANKREAARHEDVINCIAEGWCAP